MLVTILRKRWRLLLDCRMDKKYDGHCDAPTDKNKAIKIRKGLSALDELETILHETHHAADDTKDEAFVDRLSHDQALILWRLGYRRTKE